MKYKLKLQHIKRRKTLILQRAVKDVQQLVIQNCGSVNCCKHFGRHDKNTHNMCQQLYYQNTE